MTPRVPLWKRQDIPLSHAYPETTDNTPLTAYQGKGACPLLYPNAAKSYLIVTEGLFQSPWLKYFILD